mgnify:CR=1 FL=1
MCQMSQITIPREVYTQELQRLQCAYVERFGEDALSNQKKSFSRAATVARYATVVHFWSEHVPEVKPGLTMAQIATHAICTNALQQARTRLRELEIEEDVDRYVRSELL